MEDRMLSVIVPVFNVEKYLPKCIKSILDQKYQQLEIILVDDGSTDSSLEICNRFARADYRIKVIHKKNEGLVRARKTGLKQAKGEYITFVDGDDWIEPDLYLRLMEAIEFSSADFIDSGFFCDKRETSVIEERLEDNLFELDENIRHRIFLSLMNLDSYVRISPHIWAKIFKADVIRNAYINVPDDMQHGEDLINLLYCILQSDTMMQIKNVYYHYNYREDSMSHLKSIGYIRKELLLWNYCGEIILKYDKYMKQEDIDSLLFHRMFSTFEYVATHKSDVIQYYYFPHIEELFGKKIVIYGAGKVGKDYITQISKYEKCEIICWVDQQYNHLYYEYRKVISIECLMEKKYDIVLIAIEKEKLANEIRSMLIKNGISKENILWYKPETVVRSITKKII